MEDLFVPLGFFVLVGYVVYVIVSAVVRTRLMSKQASILTRAIDSAGSGEHGIELLSSPAARGLFGGRIDRRTVMLDRVISGVSTFIVLTVTGVTLLLLRGRYTAADDQATLWTVGIVTIAVGAAFLLAAGAAYLLSRRWRLLEEPDPTSPVALPPP